MRCQASSCGSPLIVAPAQDHEHPPAIGAEKAQRAASRRAALRRRAPRSRTRRARTSHDRPQRPRWNSATSTPALKSAPSAARDSAPAADRDRARRRTQSSARRCRETVADAVAASRRRPLRRPPRSTTWPLAGLGSRSKPQSPRRDRSCCRARSRSRSYRAARAYRQTLAPPPTTGPARSWRR